MERGIKLFGGIKQFEVEYDAFTFAEMIKLYTIKGDIECAQKMMETAKENSLLSVLHYNYFLNGLAVQQRQSEDENNNKNTKHSSVPYDFLENSAVCNASNYQIDEGLNKWLCFEFDDELIEYLAVTMNDLYEQMVKVDNIKPDIRTFESLLSILSYYGNSELSLHFFTELTKVYGLRPNIYIFNCLIACYCNEISLFSEKNAYEQQIDFMETNIDKIFGVYSKSKGLLVAPNVDTMKLLFHCMNARILLTQNKVIDDDEEEESEYTMESNEQITDMLYNEDMINYDIAIDEELAHHIVHCWIMFEEYKSENMVSAVEIYNDLYLEKKVISHWKDSDCIDLTKIPKKLYEDVWLFYLQYVMEHEMDKLLQLNELKILIPKFEIDDRGIDDVQSEIEKLMDVKLSVPDECNDDYMCFILHDCKSVFQFD